MSPLGLDVVAQIARIPFLRSRRDVNPTFVALLARSLHSHLYGKVREGPRDHEP